MIRYFYIVVFLFLIQPSFGQLKLYSFEEAEKAAVANPKPFVIFIHTSWCKYCKMMENTTFKNPEIIEKLNRDYYFISFDAEMKSDVAFNNSQFKFEPTGKDSGVHQLAMALFDSDQAAYPSLIILDTKYSVLFRQSSFVDSKNLNSILSKITHE